MFAMSAVTGMLVVIMLTLLVASSGKAESSEQLQCPLSQQPLPSSLVNDGIADCCDGSDEAAGAPNVCGLLRSLLVEYASNMHATHKAGFEASKSVRASVHQTKRVMAGMLAWAGSANEAALEHYSFFRQHATQAEKRQRAGQLTPAFLQLLQDARHAARQASLEASMADAAVASMQNGRSVFQASLLLAGCATSAALSTKATAGGSAEPTPSQFTYRLCPFRNATQEQLQGGAAGLSTSVLGVWLNRNATLQQLAPFPLHTVVAFIRQNAHLAARELLPAAQHVGVLPNFWASLLDDAFPPAALLPAHAQETVYAMEDGQLCDGKPRSVSTTFVCDDMSLSSVPVSHASVPASNKAFRILRVSENGKCTYLMVIGTALRCTRQSIRAWQRSVLFWSSTEIS